MLTQFAFFMSYVIVSLRGAALFARAGYGRSLLAGAAALVAPVLVSAAPDTAASLNDFAAQRAARVERLIAKGTADSLAAAALLKQFGSEGDSGSYALISRAVELAPARPDLAWLAVRLCDSASDCDSSQPNRHLREVAPSNGVGFWGDLARAQAKNDVAGVDVALTAIGNSDGVFVYFNPLIAATAPELAAASGNRSGTQPPRRVLAEATLQMIGIVAATVMPGSQGLSLSCKGISLQTEGRLEKCRRVAQALERSDTFLNEGLGLSYEQRLWPMDSPEGRAITARRRVLQYRLEEFSRLDISSPDIRKIPADYLEVIRSHEREQDTSLVYLQRAHVPSEPPESWVSRMPPRVP